MRTAGRAMDDTMRYDDFFFEHERHKKKLFVTRTSILSMA